MAMLGRMSRPGSKLLLRNFELLTIVRQCRQVLILGTRPRWVSSRSGDEGSDPLENVATSLEKASLETKAIEGEMERQFNDIRVVPHLDTHSMIAENLLKDGTDLAWKFHQQRRRSYISVMQDIW